jgi:hypothetical protein
MTEDLQGILSHGAQIYHESLILSLEVIYHTDKCPYLEPTFFSTLKTHGWQSVQCWLSEYPSPSADKPHLAEGGLNIPIHINGNHWAALHRLQKEQGHSFSMWMT